MSPLTRRGIFIGSGVALLATTLEFRHLFHHPHPVSTDGRSRQIRLAWPNTEYDSILTLARDGLFERYGLKVELVSTPGGNVAIDTLTNGHADVAAAPLLDWIPALYRDPRDRITASLVCGINGGSYRLLVRRALKLHKVGDLAGKRIGVHDMQGADRRFISIQLRRRGMHPTDSVHWVALPTDDMAEAMSSGEIDAVAVHDPFGWQIMQQTQGVSWNMLDSMTGAERGRVDLALAIASRLLEQDPGIAGALIFALKDAAKTLPSEYRNLALKWAADHDAPVDPRGMLEREIGGHVVTGHGLRVQIEQYVDELKLIGMMPDAVDPTDVAHRLVTRI